MALKIWLTSGFSCSQKCFFSRKFCYCKNCHYLKINMKNSSRIVYNIQSITPNCPTFSAKKCDNVAIWEHLRKGYYFWIIIKQRRKKVWQFGLWEFGVIDCIDGEPNFFHLQTIRLFTQVIFPIFHASYWLIEWWNLSSNFYWLFILQPPIRRLQKTST